MVNTQGFNPATGEWNDSLTGDFFWSNANIGEAMSMVMTPFTWSVVGSFYDELNVLPGYHSAGNIGGRAFQNATVMYVAFQKLGKDPLELAKEMGGGSELPKGLIIPVISLPRSATLAILMNALRILMKEKAGARNQSGFLAHNPTWCRATRQQIKAIQTKKELLALWPQLQAYSLNCFWRMVSTAWQYAESVAPLRRQLTELVGEANANTLLSGVSRESQLLASLGPVVDLSQVARGEMNRQAYLERHGHRGPYETEFSMPRPAEDPAWLDQQLSALTKAQVDVETMLANQRAEFDAAWRKFQNRHPRRAKEMQRRLEKSAQIIRTREAVRSEVVRSGWVARDFALRAGELTGLGDDIFFLTLDEILALLGGHHAPTEPLASRRATYDRYCQLPPYPSIIVGHFDPFQWAADPHRRSDAYDAHVSALAPKDAGSANVVTGAPGSGGCVEGRVRRLDRPEEGDQLQTGEIMVTAQTNIGWTLLFPRAAAVVTDVGAPLSHAAIVARELGIPAVVGCGDATVRLKTGDRVRVDGSAGTVVIVE